MTWMERLRRVIAIDLSVCSHCGQVRVIAEVTRPAVIQRMLRNVAGEQAPPELGPSRAWQTVHRRPTDHGVSRLALKDCKFRIAEAACA